MRQLPILLARSARGPLLLALAACGPRLPPEPALGDWSWAPDRSALPDGELRVLHVATAHMADRHLTAHGGRGSHDGPVSVLVVDHPREGIVLIDTGFGRRTAADVADYPGSLPSKVLGLDMGRPAVDQLADLGVATREVEHVVVTHLHTDHAGGIEDFPDARLWVSGDEWAAADRRRLLKGYDPLPYADRAPELIDFEGTDPYGPFPAHVDLFGDGSIVVVPSPGHTPGHVSVVVSLRSGSWLYLGDAAWIDLNWTVPTPKGWLPRAVLEHDWREGMEALWRARAWKDRHPELQVISGHDPGNRRLP